MTNDFNTSDVNQNPIVNPSPDFPDSSSGDRSEYLAADPAYDELLIAYQNAEWERCNKILNALLEKYPGQSKLLDFRSDLDVQLMLRNLDKSHVKTFRENKKRITLRFVTIPLIIIGIAIMIGLYILQVNQNSSLNQMVSTLVESTQTEAEVLQNLEAQARTLLQAGKAVLALDVLKQIQSIEPTYPALEELRKEAEKITQLESQYDQAMQALASNQLQDALTQLKQIQEADPQYRDVQSQIASIEQRLQIADLTEQAIKAYTDQRWFDVITAFEQVLSLDPSLTTPEMKQQLFNSYLNGIVQILENENTTFEDLAKAEEYYKKARALVPQNKQFLDERENLQKLIVNLLVRKYSQFAKDLIENQKFSEANVGQAVDFLNRASSLNPDDSTVSAELAKAQLFQIGIRNFNEFRYDPSITALAKIAFSNADYANGRLKMILYEAYCARGNQFFSLGFYLDAQRDFQAAEIIAFEKPELKLRLFQVQINTGLTLGKLRNFKDSVSYFAYALKAIDIYNRSIKDVAFLNKLRSADIAVTEIRYFDSYNLFIDALAKVDILYAYKDVNVEKGDSLVDIAYTNTSTVQSILANNTLPKVMVINSDQTLSIPYIP